MEMKKNDPLLYSIVKVARNEDLVDQIGRSIYFDLVDFDKVCCFRVQWGLAFYDFKEQVARKFHIPSQFQRYWLWGKRQNNTCRPNRPLTRMEELQSDLRPIQPPRRTSEDILVFIKLYNPIKEQLRYVGRLFVKAKGYPFEILEKLNAMAGFSSTQKIKLYEEIKFEPNVACEPIAMDLTFTENSIEDGAILCFQKSARVESGQQYRYPNVSLFLYYMHNRQVKFSDFEFLFLRLISLSMFS
ncbi:ubiquitinyl hydrolase 1 [Ranunculus cassubicifolius]